MLGRGAEETPFPGERIRVIIIIATFILYFLTNIIVFYNIGVRTIKIKIRKYLINYRNFKYILKTFLEKFNFFLKKNKF